MPLELNDYGDLRDKAKISRKFSWIICGKFYHPL